MGGVKNDKHLSQMATEVTIIADIEVLAISDRRPSGPGVRVPGGMSVALKKRESRSEGTAWLTLLLSISLPFLSGGFL